ncbi:MAG: class II glutamine amidotransferase [Myxococcales bacterium]|nr:MAG: class II glutamine amidotransferase [Myxococcales bacterium]
MSRFILYSGEPVLISDVLYDPSNSLAEQAREPKEMRRAPVNGDGFGFGWYVPDVSPEPCVVRTMRPAWADENLRAVARKTRTRHLLAHVRAAVGDRIVETNVHPFAHGPLLWAHNGVVEGIDRLRRPIRDSLGDRAYGMIAGTSDAEFVFGLFVDSLDEAPGATTAAGLRRALVKAIGRLQELSRQVGIEKPSFLNFVVTDGHASVASRYVTDPHEEAASLHHARGTRYVAEPAGSRVEPCADDAPAAVVVVASEPLTGDQDAYPMVPQNHTITVHADRTVELTPIFA